MARNIGPRIGIDGEKEYRAEMMNIIQQQKTLQSEMKATSSAFDKDSKSKDKNKAITAKLTDLVENQEKRIAKLREGVEKSAKETGENSTATLKWKEALADAESELNKLNKELDESKGMSSFSQKLKDNGEQLKNIGGKVEDAGNAMTKGLTAPILALGGASTVAFKEVDAGLDIIVQKTGASGEALDEMTQSFENIATTIPTDFETVGTAIGEVNTRFGLTGENLEQLSGQFIKFAELNGTDVNSSIDSIQKAMNAFGIDAEQASVVLDHFNVVGQATGVDVQKLSQDLTTNASALQQMGYSLSDSATFLGNLDKSGVDATAVMSGLKKALANATAEGIPMNEALTNLETSLKSAGSQTEANAIAMELFGQKAGPAIAQACNDGILSFEQLNTSMSDSAGSVSTTFEDTLDPIDKWQTTMNELKLIGADLGDTLMTTLKPALEKLNKKLKELNEKWDKLSPSQKEMITKTLLLVATIGPLVAIIGKTIMFAGSLSTALGVLGVSFSAIALPITAAIAVGVLLYKNWDTIKEYAQKLGDGISKTWDGIKQKTTDVWDKVSSTIKNKIDSAKEHVRNSIERIKGFFNFSWSLPELKIPHFRISGGVPPYGFAGKGSFPSVDIDWYKKGYEGLRFDKPTVLQTANGYKGFGDGNGAELVIGEDMMYRNIRRAVASEQTNSQTTKVGEININVFANDNQNVDDLTDAIEERFNERLKDGELVYG